MQTSTTPNGPFPPGQTYRIFLGGKWVDGKEHVEIRFPYDRSVLVGRVAWANLHDADDALELAQQGARAMACKRQGDSGSSPN